MHAILITFDQAFYQTIVDLLERNNSRGFTAWTDVRGRGSKTGEPHYGTHAWPSMASAIITMVDNSRVDLILNLLHELDVQRPKLGLRAFAWPIDKSI